MGEDADIRRTLSSGNTEEGPGRVARRQRDHHLHIGNVRLCSLNHNVCIRFHQCIFQDRSAERSLVHSAPVLDHSAQRTSSRELITLSISMISKGTIPGARSLLRQGLDLEPPPPGAGRSLLLSVPFFHVTGLTSLTVSTTS